MDAPVVRLLSVAERVVPGWVRSSIERHLVDATSCPPQDIQTIVDGVAAGAIRDLCNLLSLDPEEQRTNPLTVLRRATVPITAFLTEIGAKPVLRDEFQQRSFPDDFYALCPATWADVSEDLVEPGLEWGAWKAAMIITRRRPTPNT